VKSGNNKFRNLTVIRDGRGRVVGCGSMLEAGRVSVRVLVEVEFLICLMFPAALWPQWSTQLVTEVSTRNLPGRSWEYKAAARTADNLADICGPNV
jgi:hypothetical protein